MKIRKSAFEVIIVQNMVLAIKNELQFLVVLDGGKSKRPEGIK